MHREEAIEQCALKLLFNTFISRFWRVWNHLHQMNVYGSSVFGKLSKYKFIKLWESYLFWFWSSSQVYVECARFSKPNESDSTIWKNDGLTCSG